jgi:hypothetical protein
MNAVLEITNYNETINRAIPVPVIDNTFKRKEGKV